MMHKCIELGKRVATREGTKAKINPVSLAEKTFRLHRTNTALAIVWQVYAYICGQQTKPPFHVSKIQP